MEHTTNTRVIFADSPEDAKEKYQKLVKPEHDPNPKIDVCKVTEEEDFDTDSPFNLIGEVSVGAEVMEEIKKDIDRAYVIYYIEKA